MRLKPEAQNLNRKMIKKLESEISKNVEENETLTHQVQFSYTGHPDVELRVNLKSISNRCYLFEVAFVWESAPQTILWPLGCL